MVGNRLSMSQNLGDIVAIGGGGFGRNPKKPIIEDYILKLSPAPKPNITFFPTASAEDQGYIINFYDAFSKLHCSPKHISLFKQTPDLESIIKNSDVIYVGGGNTKSMIAVFKEWGLDKMLFKAYKDGKVLSGVSAGAICWFDKGITDSWADELKLLDCLDFLPGVCCPHYDGEVNRRPSIENFLRKDKISHALCIEDGAAVHFKNGMIKTAVSFYENKNSYNVALSGDNLIENPLNKIDIK